MSNFGIQNKQKNHHSTHEYAAARLKERQVVALENLDKRLGLSDEKIVWQASRFKDVESPNKKDIEKYRQWLREQKKTLEEKIA